MSTPSTATATLLPHHQYFPHHQPYQSTIPGYHYDSGATNGAVRAGANYNAYANNAQVSQDHRRTTTLNSRPQTTAQQQQPAPQMPTPTESSDMSRKRDRKQPDWGNFYKNGLPKEVIVIDDSEEEDQPLAKELPPPAQPASSTRAAAQTAKAPATNGTSRHADKRRKVGAGEINNVYHQQPQYSTPHSASYTNGSSSTDRTTSAIHTTAPTSLGSQASNKAYVPPLEEGTVGQKRKRTTRKAAAEEAKRREIETQSDPYSRYIPPPKPPIKAKDVYVRVIPDEPASRDQKVDDEDGHYVVVPEASLTEKYQIIRLLGQGTFGKVVEAYDRRKGTRCAIKIIRSVPKYRDASRIELRVLSTLKSNDEHNRNQCIHLRECFDFRNHICIVTDLLSQSVFDFLKSNQFVPFPLSQIQSFARQLFHSVAFLHDLNLIHTDLKPENILLVNSAYQTFTYNRQIPSSSNTQQRSARHRKVLLEPEIRLIDFGSATFDDEYHSSVVSTRHYRAPEIILNLGWSFPCDIWSIGCILVEFFTGDALFQTHDNLEHLAMMEAVCGGKLEKELVKRVVSGGGRGGNRNAAAQYFTRGCKLDYPNAETPRASRKYVKAMKQLTDIIPAHTDFNRSFLDLLKKIFVYDPEKRITAHQALQHPWFKETIQDDGTEAAKIRLARLANAEETRRRQ